MDKRLIKKKKKIRFHDIALRRTGKVKECMDLSTNRLLMICTEVEEFQFHFRIAYELGEALPIVGLQPAEQAPELF
ncbi:MAG: hypothetical protein GF353_02565 [Candidatus Lokiarchaeota archaeon]|nr:hypothetical protein [Candidatus Lokiarchaeota archaeon]